MGCMAVTAHPFPLPTTEGDADTTRLMNEPVALLQNRSVGDAAPPERLPRRERHAAGEIEARSCVGNNVAWTRQGRAGVLTPAVIDALAWAASSSGAAASTAMGSGAVKERAPSVLHWGRISRKNLNKTQPLAVFKQSPSTANTSHLLPQLGPASTPRDVGFTPHRRHRPRRSALASTTSALGHIW
jgi:hypothetical protein